MPTSQVFAKTKSSKFDASQDVLKKQAQAFDDSDEDEVEEVDKQKVESLFRNYQGNETDVSRITQFFENGENVDCLICKDR